MSDISDKFDELNLAHNRLLNLVADIRKAAGDEEGKLMQDELVESIGQQRFCLAATENTIAELGKRFEQMHEERNAAYAQLESMPRWTAIDYANHETFPDENRNCLVAWTWDDGTHPDRAAMYQFNDCGDCMMLWGNAVTGDVMDWDGIWANPTHWMYAPEFKQ
jgi:hypothetical protein